MKAFRPALFLLSSFLFTAAAFAQSDIFVTKDGSSNTTAGSNIVYTITVGDTGPDATSPAVNLTDVIPAGLTFVSLAQSGPDSFVCSTPTVGTNGTVSCDVRALAGVLHGDQKASKGMVTTTSDFAPKIATDPYLAPLMPYCLELMNGDSLRKWIGRLSAGGAI